MMGNCFYESGHWGTYCEAAHADIVQGESEDLGCTMTWYGARSDDAPLFPGSTDSGDDASSSSEKELNTQEYAYYDSLPTPGAISPTQSRRAPSARAPGAARAPRLAVERRRGERGTRGSARGTTQIAKMAPRAAGRSAGPAPRRAVWLGV